MGGWGGAQLCQGGGALPGLRFWVSESLCVSASPHLTVCVSGRLCRPTVCPTSESLAPCFGLCFTDSGCPSASSFSLSPQPLGRSLSLSFLLSLGGRPAGIGSEE